MNSCAIGVSGFEELVDFGSFEAIFGQLSEIRVLEVTAVQRADLPTTSGSQPGKHGDHLLSLFATWSRFLRFYKDLLRNLSALSGINPLEYVDLSRIAENAIAEVSFSSSISKNDGL